MERLTSQKAQVFYSDCSILKDEIYLVGMILMKDAPTVIFNDCHNYAVTDDITYGAPLLTTTVKLTKYACVLILPRITSIWQKWFLGHQSLPTRNTKFAWRRYVFQCALFLNQKVHYRKSDQIDQEPSHAIEFCDQGSDLVCGTRFDADGNSNHKRASILCKRVINSPGRAPLTKDWAKIASSLLFTSFLLQYHFISLRLATPRQQGYHPIIVWSQQI